MNHFVESNLLSTTKLCKQASITLVIPSYNQGDFLDRAISSVFEQNIPVEVYVMDGGSTDESIDIIRKWETKLAGWYSGSDGGQSSAINQGIANGDADYVCWLNSDDWLLPNGLELLKKYLDGHQDCPAVYGKAWNYIQNTGKKEPIWVEPFSVKRLALRCVVSQPATLIRRSVWESLNGLDVSLDMVMDYDLWWRIYKRFGPMSFLDEYIAVNRDHGDTKTNSYRKKHYKEAIQTVRKHYGRVPIKWWLFQPYSVWYKSFFTNR